MKAKEYIRITHMIKDINKMWRETELAIVNEDDEHVRENIIGILNCMDILATELDKA